MCVIVTFVCVCVCVCVCACVCVSDRHAKTELFVGGRMEG
jgi:hypothetical protein